MPNISSSAVYIPSTKTFGAAQAEVARVISGANQPQSLSEAADAIQNAMRWWARKTPPWSYLNVTVPDIPVVAGTANYEMPGNLQHIYSVRLGTLGDPLHYIEPRTYDRFAGDQTIRDYPSRYTLFSRGQTNEITLVPTPVADNTLIIRGVRQVTIPTTPAELLDVLEPDVGAVIHYAKALVLGDRSGAADRRNFHMEQAEQGRAESRQRDRHEEDDDLILIPSSAETSPYPRDYYNDYLW